MTYMSHVVKYKALVDRNYIFDIEKMTIQFQRSQN